MTIRSKQHRGILCLFLFLTLNLFCASNVTARIGYTSNSFDTTIKNWFSTPMLDDNISDSIAQDLFDNNIIFQECWNNDMLFVYEHVKYEELKDTNTIQLVKGDEQFQLTWYGNVNSPYGRRWGRMHHGVDLYLRSGDTVVSAFDGIVRYADFNKGGYGNCVIVRHVNGLETLYGHLSKIEVDPNQFVKAGQLIGLAGSTGRSDGPHLHFETRYKDFSINSFYYVDQSTTKLKGDTMVLIRSNVLNYRYPTDAKNKLNVMEDEKGIKDPTKKYSQGNQSKYHRTNKKVRKVKPRTHTVKKGESISVIARKYKTTWVKLRQLNHLKPNSKLKPGQKLKVK